MTTVAAAIKPKRNLRKILRAEYVLYFFVAPAIIFTLLFNYLPLFINVIAFMDYDIFQGWMGLGSPFVGFKHFKAFLSEPAFPAIALRTVYYALVKLAFAFPAPIILALLLNELRSSAYKRTVQTITYLPYFVSWVTVSSLVYLFLSTSASGIVNNLVEALGGERTVFMGDPKYFLPVLVVTDVWKGMGFGSIIYIAAIASIDQQLYEAARIDGAGRWQCMIHITIPGIMGATVIILILSMGGIFNSNFDQMFTLLNPAIRSQTYVINIWAYQLGIALRKFSLGTAVNLFQGVVNFMLVWITNYASKRIRGTGLF